MSASESWWVALAQDGGAMEKINLPFFYQLGAQLNPLAETNMASATKPQVLLAIFRLRRYLRSLLDGFPSLTVCRTAGTELMAAIEEADKWFESVTSEQLRGKIEATDTEFHEVIAKAKLFETILSAELETLATYHATQKGIYSTPDLIERAENIMPESLRARLTPQVVEEIRQSGRCLAFDNATAAGFHIMRATEAVMHDYYIAVCKPRRKPKARLDSWGAYLAALKTCKDADVQEVVAILQQIKDQHRNLIMHPEEVLSPDQAFTLFEVAQGAIIAMASKLPRPKKTPQDEDSAEAQP